MIVAAEREDAAVAGGAGGVGLLQHVARAVDAGRLAVPHAEDAVVVDALAVKADLLRAPDGGGAELLVHPGLEVDVEGIEPRGVAFELLVDAAQRRAAIAGNEGCGLAVRLRYRAPLVDRNSDERLDTC